MKAPDRDRQLREDRQCWQARCVTGGNCVVSAEDAFRAPAGRLTRIMLADRTVLQ